MQVNHPAEVISTCFTIQTISFWSHGGYRSHFGSRYTSGRCALRSPFFGGWWFDSCQLLFDDYFSETRCNRPPANAKSKGFSVQINHAFFKLRCMFCYTKTHNRRKKNKCKHKEAQTLPPKTRKLKHTKTTQTQKKAKLSVPYAPFSALTLLPTAILRRIYPIPSELGSQATQGPDSTGVGDRLGSP